MIIFSSGFAPKVLVVHAIDSLPAPVRAVRLQLARQFPNWVLVRQLDAHTPLRRDAVLHHHAALRQLRHVIRPKNLE